MKKKDLENLKIKTKDELKKMAADIELEIKKLKTEMISGKVKNLNSLRLKMKDKARILTLIKGGNS